VAAPTLTSSAISTWSDNANVDEVTATLTWNSGDRVVVVGMTEDQGFILSTPTATGLTFTALGTAVTVANSCWLHVWTATAGSSGSGAITASRATSTGVAMRGIAAFAFGGSTGFVRTNKGGGAGTVNSTQTVSVTRTQANSAVVVVIGDWSAGSSGSATWTPAGATQLVAQTNTGGTAFVARWGDQGATGTTSYGTSGAGGSAFTISAVEVLGTASSSTTASAEAATGAGAAEAPVPAGAAAAGVAAATAAAADPAISTAGSAAAEAATGAAAAADPLAALTVLAEVASAAAAANTPTVTTGGGGGGAESLFTSQTPALADNSDGTPGITVGTTIKFATAGQVSAARFYATSTVSGTYTVGLWRVDTSDPGGGTLLASKTMSGSPTGGTWNTVAFDTPVSVTATDVYRIGVFSSAGRYVATTGYAPFATSGPGLTNGNLYAPANNANPVGALTVSQGVFRIDSSFDYPNTSGNGSNYFADLVYETAGASTTATAETASGSGAALDAAAAVLAGAEAVSAAAGAEQPAVSTSSAVTAAAGVASAAATANAPAVSVPGGVQTLFTNQTPSSGNNSDGTPGITVGTTLRFTVDGTVTGVRFYSTATVGGTYIGALYQIEASDPGSGPALASKTLTGSPASSSWTTITFDSPVPVTAGTAYRAAVFNSEGRYVATGGFFSADLANGALVADADGDTVGGYVISQGVFRIDSEIGYPNGTFGSTNYFVDATFVTGTPVTVTAECATAGGEALFDPGTAVSLSMVADAPVLAAGAAHDASPALIPAAGSAAGAAGAEQPAAGLRALPDAAAAAASAYDAAVTVLAELIALAETATGTAAAPFEGGLSVSVELIADEPVPAAAAAYNPAIVITFQATPATAEASGQAYQAVAITTAVADLSAASGLTADSLATRMAAAALTADTTLTATGAAITTATVSLGAASSMTAVAGYAAGLLAVAAEHAITVRRPTGVVRRTVPAR
jgi:hypothetical protein